VVGLVDDDQVPVPAGDGRAVRFALGGVDGGDDVVEFIPGRGATVAEGRVVVADQVQGELAAHLALPLLDERGGRQDEDRADQAAQAKLGRDQAASIGLAQADLVAQERLAAESLVEHGSGRARLVIEQLHVADLRQTDELVEARIGAEQGRPCGPG